MPTGTDGGSGSSVSGGMNMGRERLQSKNDYSYLGQDSQTSPLEDLGMRLMDTYNQGNAQSNLLFGGPGYGGSFKSRGGAAPPPGGGPNPPLPPPPPPPPGSGGPVLPGPQGPPLPGPGNQPPGGSPNASTGAPSDAELAQIKQYIPSARRMPNGNITWDGLKGDPNGETSQAIQNRLRLITSGQLTPGPSGAPVGAPPAPEAPGATPYVEAAPPSAPVTPETRQWTPGDPYDPFGDTPQPEPGPGQFYSTTPPGGETSPLGMSYALPDAGIDGGTEAQLPGGGMLVRANNDQRLGPYDTPDGGYSGPTGGVPTPDPRFGNPGQGGVPGTATPPYAAGMDPRYGTWNPNTGKYDMNVPMQDGEKFPVHDPNYNPLDPTWKYYTQQKGNTYVPLNPGQRNDADWARTSPVTPQGSNINDAWSTSPDWRPEAPTGGLYGGYTDMAGENYDPFENLQQSLAGLMATGQKGGVDDPTVRVLMDSWAKLYNQPGYSDTAKNAISQEGMLGARGAADANSANIMAMARRTNNPMAAYAALGDVSRGESQALGSNARKNAIDFENAARGDQQQARLGYGDTINSALGRTQQGLTQLGGTNQQILGRRQAGLAGQMDLYKNQQNQNNSLLQQLQSLYSTRREDNTQLGKTEGSGGLWA